MPIKAVLFDFDGTLVETRAASWLLFAETDREFGLGLDTQEKFFGVFAGNFFESLAAHCGNVDKAKAAAEHFMQLVADRYNPEFIPGIAAVVRDLAGYLELGIVSSNRAKTIRRILRSADLERYFPRVLAGDVEPSKASAIRNFLGDLAPGMTKRNAFAPAEVAFVTDTTGDVAEGLSCGLAVYGVTWGMHSKQQLLAAGAVRIAASPHELFDWLMPTPGVAAETLEDCRA